MNAPTEPNTPIDSCPWIQIRCEGCTHVFRLSEHEVVSVGASANADVRLTSPAASPLLFHIERRRDAVYLVPAYCAGLLVNARRVQGPRAITSVNLIESPGIDLEVTVLDTPPASFDATVRSRASAAEVPVPHESLVTAQVLPTGPLPDAVAQTAIIPGPNGDGPLLGPFGTEVMRPIVIADGPPPHVTATLGTVDPQQPATRPHATATLGTVEPQHPATGPHATAPPAEVAEKPPASPPFDRSSLERLPAVPDTPFGASTTQFEIPVAHPSDTPPRPRVPRSTELVAPSAEQADSPSSRRDVTQSRRRSASAARPASWIAQVGLYTQRHPLRTAFVTLGCAALLALALLGASRLLNGSSLRSATPTHSSPPSGEPGATASTAPPVEPLRPAPSALPSVGSAGRSASSPAPLAISSADPTPDSTQDSTSAVGHLVAGRYLEASKAYAALAKSSNDGTFDTLARLLAQRTAPQCTASEPNGVSCPQVKR